MKKILITSFLLTLSLFAKDTINDEVKDKMSAYDVDTLVMLADKSEKNMVYQSSQMYYKLAFSKLMNKFNDGNIKLLKSQDSSMSPIIKKGDEFISIKTKDVKRGDLMIFKKPNSNEYDIKRCIATPKDLIAIRNKQIFLHPSEGNEFVLENYPKEDILKVAGKLWVKNPYKLKFPTIKDDKNLISNTKISSSLVPSGKYFVMGDNRDHSNDSRNFGMVDGENIFKPLLVIENKEIPTRKGIEIKDTFN